MVTGKVKSKHSQKNLLGATLTNRAPYKMSLDCTHIPSEKPLPNHPLMVDHKNNILHTVEYLYLNETA